MIHNKLRDLRKKNNKRLQDVAEANDMSTGYLSQIETGKVEPSIAQLRRLAAYYGVGVVYFFGSDETDQILVRAEERPTFGRPDSPLVYELLRNNMIGFDLQAAIIKIAPHYEEPQGLFVTCQNEELIYVLSGVLGFEYNGQMYLAHKGDSICYRANLPYRLFNPSDEVTEILGIGTPATL